MSKRKGVIGASWLIACCIAGGCANQGPSGQTNGRVDPYDTKGREQSDAGITMAALLEASDQATMAIAERIGATFASHSTKVVIELGWIRNATNTPASDFEMLRRRVSGRLINSEAVRNVAKIMESPESMDQQAARFSQEAPPDRLDEATSSGGTATFRYAASDTYLLNGEFHEATRGGASTYYLEMTLTNLQTREIVFAQPFDFKQVR